MVRPSAPCGGEDVAATALAPERRIAIERDRDDIGVDGAGALRQRAWALVELAMLFKLGAGDGRALGPDRRAGFHRRATPSSAAAGVARGLVGLGRRRRRKGGGQCKTALIRAASVASPLRPAFPAVLIRESRRIRIAADPQRSLPSGRRPFKRPRLRPFFFAVMQRREERNVEFRQGAPLDGSEADPDDRLEEEALSYSRSRFLVDGVEVGSASRGPGRRIRNRGDRLCYALLLCRKWPL